MLLGGCGGAQEAGRGEAGHPLLVMAAASLNRVMPELIERFETTHDTRIDLVLGSTGNLAAQIEHGAPADLFFSADEATPQRMTGRGLIGEVRPYASGRLALVWREGLPPLESLEALRSVTYRTIVIANPEHAPYGLAARQALEEAGLWDELEGRVVQGENVAQAYQFVQTGNADAALVSLSVVDRGGGRHRSVDPRLHPPLIQAAGVLNRSAHPAAERFLYFVLSDEGQTILSEHGFGPGAP